MLQTKKPTSLNIIGVSQGHPSLSPFQDVPYPRRRVLGMQLIGVAPFIGILGFAMILMLLFPSLRTGLDGGAVAFAAFFIGAGASLAATLKLCFIEMKREKAEDTSALGAPSLDERYVGISYSEGVAIHGLDTSWDRGFLSWDNGALTFRGHGPSFRLPSNFIQEVYVAPTNAIGTLKLPRVMLRWMDPDGISQFICFEVRDGSSRKEIEGRTQLLRHWLEEGIAKSDSIEALAASELPFRSSAIEDAVTFDRDQLTYKDHLAAFALSMVVVVVVEVLLVILSLLFNWRIGGNMGALIAPIWMVTWGVVLSRRSRKHRLERKGNLVGT